MAQGVPSVEDAVAAGPPGSEELEGRALALWNEGRQDEAIAILEQQIALSRSGSPSHPAVSQEPGPPADGVADPAVQAPASDAIVAPATLSLPRASWWESWSQADDAPEKEAPAPVAVGPNPPIDGGAMADPGTTPVDAKADDAPTKPTPHPETGEVAHDAPVVAAKPDKPASAPIVWESSDASALPPPEPPQQAAALRSPPKRRGRVRRVLGLVAGSFLLLFVGVGLWIAWGIHRIDLAKPPNPRPSLLLEAADGTPINQNGGSYAGPVTREEVPEHLIRALVAIEDRRFYEHMGIDPLGIVRAAARNVSAGGIVEGGSTITQQLAKNLFLDPEQTLHRKAQEAAIAIWLDFRMSKDEIITKYLDSIYFGAGATGVSAAAKIYFDKPVRQLNLAESAMLAGIVRAPSRLNPQANLAEARERAALVVNAMVEMGFIRREEALAAVMMPAAPVRGALVAQSGGWFSDWVEAELEEAMGPLAGAARVRTTLQPRLQGIAENVVKTALDRRGAELNVGQAALVAMTPEGAVVAMVGGHSYQDTQFNRAVKAKRQPGSTFTVALYLAAMRLGWKPDDKILDAPIEIDGWAPKNFEDRYAGEVTVEQAFARSLTAATVRLAREVGIENVIRAARDLGIDAELDPNLALVLGTEEVTPLDLTGAYAAMASGRIPQEPWFVAGVTDDPGAKPSFRPQGAGPTRALDHQAELRRILNAAVRQGTGEQAAMNGFVAGKTGTSQDYRDGWFLGFTDTLVAGVWVGNDDNSPMKNVTGGDLPAEIWRDFMAKATGLDPMQIPQSPPPPPASVVAGRGGDGDPAAVEEEGSAEPVIAEASQPVPESPAPELRSQDPSPIPAPTMDDKAATPDSLVASAPPSPEPPTPEPPASAPSPLPEPLAPEPRAAALPPSEPPEPPTGEPRAAEPPASEPRGAEPPPAPAPRVASVPPAEAAPRAPIAAARVVEAEPVPAVRAAKAGSNRAAPPARAASSREARPATAGPATTRPAPDRRAPAAAPAPETPKVATRPAPPARAAQARPAVAQPAPERAAKPPSEAERRADRQRAEADRRAKSRPGLAQNRAEAQRYAAKRRAEAEKRAGRTRPAPVARGAQRPASAEPAAAPPASSEPMVLRGRAPRTVPPATRQPPAEPQPQLNRPETTGPTILLGGRGLP